MEQLHDNDNNGNGHTNYYELGLLFKKELKNNTYLNGSIKLGQINSRFVNNTFIDMYGNSANYKTNSLYYSAHLGLEKVLNLSETSELELLARYLCSHQNGNKANISTDQFNFKGINSNRLQLGTKYTFGKTNR